MTFHLRFTASAVLLAALAAIVSGLAVPRTSSAATLSTTASADASAYVLPSGPYAGKPLYVNPANSAATAAASTSDATTKALLTKIARVPQASWLTGGTAASAGTTVAGQVSAAAGAVTQFVVYDVPGRDCTGGQSSGGAASSSDYLAYVAAVAGALNHTPAIVVLEPDALADLDCLSATAQTTRLSLLKQAGQKLAAAGAQVYLDAGHSHWQSATTMASRLIKAGIVGVRGFALDTSNFDPTAAELSYGLSISAQVGWKRFVVDTSRDGTDPVVSGWCNPFGAALGALPATVTGSNAADAFLWVKHPGESDGVCGTSTKPAGSFDVNLAVALAHNAGW